MEKVYSGWIKKSPLLKPRSHSAIAAYKEKIYVFGGGGEGFQSLKSTEIYDIERDVWYQGRDIPTTRSGAATALLNDKIYVMGGGLKLPDGQFEFFNIVEIYDPETDTWGRGTDMLMPHDFPASVVVNGCIYIIGGHHPDATKGGPLTDPGFSFCEVFNPDSGKWREIAPMPTSRFALASVVLDNKIVALGGGGLRGDGFKNFDIVECYDPLNNTWSNAGFNLPWSAAGLGACTVNNKLYIVGGNSGEKIEDRFACYDPLTRKWIELEPLDEGRIVMGIVQDGQDGKTIYIIGGRGGDGKTPVNKVETYRVSL
ncbi:MAG: hypothetical protein A3D21_01050 [Nitrospirae bacterium RIFCSPHIGHO2_02_FULL_42_12]|nr:MAG: hypothetical protein A3D21_01050 [Nitrospirae bacterium RIFCSPHIGHO2_02_FULL_42_12]